MEAEKEENLGWIFDDYFIYKNWGRADSNRRKPKPGDLQSPAIATMRHPQRVMLAKGIEPSTVRLQVGCSTIELHQQKETA